MELPTDADFSALERRVLALQPRDDMALQFLDPTPLVRSADGTLQPEDPYIRRAANLFGVPYEAVSEAQRRYAKTTAFGEIYGLNLSHLAGIHTGRVPR